MMDLAKYILGEFSVIRGAPIAFMLSIIAVGSLLFYLMSWGYGRENSYLRTQLDDYKEKLKGATPQEARDRIDQLEKMANLVIGKPWQPLLPAEIAKLAEQLKPIADQFRVQLMYENALGQDLAQTFADAFNKAGWTKYALMPGSGLGAGLSTGRGSDATLKLKSAIEASTTYKVSVIRPGEVQLGDLVYLAVGVNSN
jgi:hypothetical protein